MAFTGPDESVSSALKKIFSIICILKYFHIFLFLLMDFLKLLIVVGEEKIEYKYLF